MYIKKRQDYIYVVSLVNFENHQNEQNLAQIHWISCQIHQIFMKLAMFRAPQAPPQPKTMRQTKYLDPKACHEKKSFFFRKCFFADFSLFSRHQNPKNRDLADLAMCTSLPVAWSITSGNRSPLAPCPTAPVPEKLMGEYHNFFD